MLYFLVLILIILVNIKLSSSELSSYIANSNNNAIVAVNDSTFFICGDDSKLIKTTNYGQTWSWIDLKEKVDYLNIVYNPINNHIYLLSQNNLKVSSDIGESWQEYLSEYKHIEKIKIIDDNLYFVNQNRLYRQTGKLTELVFDKAEKGIIDFDFDKDTLHIIDSNSYYKSVNGIQLNRKLFTGKYEVTLISIFKNKNNIIIGSQDFKSFKDSVYYSPYFIKSKDNGINFIIDTTFEYGIILGSFHNNNKIYSLTYYKIIEFDSLLRVNRMINLKDENYFKPFSKDIIINNFSKKSNDEYLLCGREQTYGIFKNANYKLLNYYPSRLITRSIINNNIILMFFNGQDKYVIGGPFIGKSQDGGITYNQVFPFDTLNSNLQLTDNPYLNTNFNTFSKYKIGDTLFLNCISNFSTPIQIIYFNNKIYSKTINRIINNSTNTDNYAIKFENNKVYYSNKDIESWSQLNYTITSIKSTSLFLGELSFINNDRIGFIQTNYHNSQDSVNNPKKISNSLYVIDYNLERKEFQIIDSSFSKEKKFTELDTSLIKLHSSNGYLFILRRESQGLDTKSYFMDLHKNSFIKRVKIPAIFQDIYAKNDDQMIAVADSDKVYYTINGGDEWKMYKISTKKTLAPFISNSLTKIYKESDTTFDLIGINRIAKLKINFDRINKIEEETNNVLIFKPYPNPTNSFISSMVHWNSYIDFNISNVEVYNFYGAKIKAEIELIKQGLGIGEIRIDCSCLSSGIYFIRVNLNNEYKSTAFCVGR
jgi:hypothetical protein